MKRLLRLFVLLALISVPCQAQKLIRVPQDRPTIQAGVNAARVGDTVLVDRGLYYENVRVNKNIVLTSRFILDRDTSHISRTIIDGSRPVDSLKASVVMISGKTDTTCVLIGFTIRGGTGTHMSSSENQLSRHWIAGGGVFVLHAGARIAYNIVTQNILCERTWASFTGGAGIATGDTSNGRMLPPAVIIEHNMVTRNVSTGEWGEEAGIAFFQPGVVRHNVVTDNRVVSRTRSPAGGIGVGFTADYDIVVDGNYISRNSAGIAGGLLITGEFVSRGRAIVTNNIITENKAFELGGAVNVVEQSYAVFINNTIVRNKTLSHAGGINIAAGAHATLVNNILWDNDLDQVSIWGYMQAYNNLVEGGLPGRDNIDADPAFLPGDSLYRLSLNSPGINIGVSSLQLLDEPFPMPQRDFSGITRLSKSGNLPDLGATESLWSSNSSSERILSERRNATDASVKLTVIFRQISGVERKPGTQEIVRAGQMRTTVIVNNSLRHYFEQTAPNLSFVLPPGENLLELEVFAQARDTTKRLNVFYRLEGFESNVSILNKLIRFKYHSYADLKPGSYRLTLQPQDDEDIIGHTNRVSFDVVVLPFWYQRWWAYVLYAFGVISLAFLSYRVRTKRLRLEYETSRLSELDRMKSRFFANLSHEFRTPLSLILGPADHLETSEKDPPRKEQLSVIRRNAERLLRMVNLLLQFARIEAGTLKLRVSPQPIPPLLRRIVSSFTTAAVKKGVALQSEIQPASFEGYIETEKVEHIVENLLSNAIKYTNAGGRVVLMARRRETELVIVVSDTGIGISEDQLEHVFERFYRADASHQTEGTGIGLSLTRELVELHRGSISLTSTPGVGTVATVQIPISGYREDEIAPASEAEPAEPPAEAGRPRLAIEMPPEDRSAKTVVLIAEDNDDARSYLRTRLAPEYEVLEAPSGKEAIQRARDHVPDIVVSDVMMPEMNGYELCRELKTDVRTSHIPVILLTALAEQTDRILGLETGADDYLVKPFDAHELVVRVRNLIANRKKLQERFRTSAPLKPGDVEVESLDNKFLGKVMSIVESHISEEQFDIEQFAREVHLSRGQLHRKLKALTSLSPTDFIRYLRLQRARDLLEKRAGTVSEVAFQLGFSNLSYFSKSFKEQFGLLPSEVK